MKSRLLSWKSIVLYVAGVVGGALIYLAPVIEKDYSLSLSAPDFSSAHDSGAQSCMDESVYLVKKFHSDDDKYAALQKGATVSFLATEEAKKAYGREVTFIKNIVAVPGDRIKIEGENVFINGELFSKRSPFMMYQVAQNGFAYLLEDKEYTLAENEFFAMGTNEEHSFDSRFWGPVKVENLVGSVFWKGF